MNNSYEVRVLKVEQLEVFLFFIGSIICLFFAIRPAVKNLKRKLNEVNFYTNFKIMLA